MRRILSVLAAIIVVVGGVIGAFAIAANADDTGSPTVPSRTDATVYPAASVETTWDCDSHDAAQCPWGAGGKASGGSSQALHWPADLGPRSARLGYTTRSNGETAGVYLPASAANGLTLRITSGSPVVYAGDPASTATQRQLTPEADGVTYQIAGLADDEALSVQAGRNATFTYRLTVPTDQSPAPPPSTTPTDPTGPTDTSTPTAPPTLPTAVSGDSAAVTSTCTTTVVGQCPYGTGTVYGSGKPDIADSSFTEQSLVWPASLNPVTKGELGYTAGQAIYLPAPQANDLTVTVTSGWAALLVGQPGFDARTTYRILRAGESVQVTGVPDGRSLSVQGSASFGWTVSPDPVEGAAIGPSAPAATSGCRDVVTDLASCDLVSSIPVNWKCDPAACSVPTDDWSEQAVAWPEGQAYDNNGRTQGGANYRDTFRGDTDVVDSVPVYTYMGAWADGCTVTSLVGQAQIIEWDYGSELWRQTTLEPGHTHTIDLGKDAAGNAENGAMIETGSAAPTTVKIENCTPGPVDGQ